TFTGSRSRAARGWSRPRPDTTTCRGPALKSPVGSGSIGVGPGPGPNESWSMSTRDEGKNEPLALVSPAGDARSTIAPGSAFEHLAAELATTFVDIAAEAVDSHIETALGRIAQALELDRSAVVQRVEGHFLVTHEWTRPGFPRLPSAVIPEEA